MKYSIGMTTYNRPEYLKTTLDTLAKSDLTLAKEVLIFDDGSSGNVIQMLKEFKGKLNVPVKIYRNRKSLGANLNIAQACDFIFNKNDLAILIDSDSKFGKQWLNKINEAVILCDRENIAWGYISVFNTPNHKTIKNINSFLVQKKDLGSFGTIIKKEIFKKMTKNENFRKRNVSFDWKYGWQCDLDKKLILCTKNSYIQHIGLSGTNSNKNSVDIGVNFMEN